jgi:sugar/nucleoside kinase (ribokinase family)
MRVFCAGMLVYDVYLGFVPSDIMCLDSHKINAPNVSCGGDALNVAISLSRLNLDVSVSGRIGKDSYGHYILSECKKHNIDTSNVVIDNLAPTATTFALIDFSGERHFLTNNDIFSNYGFTDINLSELDKSNFVYFGSLMSFPKMDNGGLARLFSEAIGRGVPTVLDAAFNDANLEFNWLEFLSPILKFTKYFFPSLREAQEITRKEDLIEIADIFSQFGMEAFGIKLGKDGCFVTDFQQERIIPAVRKFPIKNTTGAGDAFISGLIYGLSRGESIFRCVELGNIFAALRIGEVIEKQEKYNINLVNELLLEID